MSYYDKEELLKYFSKQIKQEADIDIKKLEKYIVDTKKRQLEQIDNELQTSIFKSMNSQIDELESEHNATISKLKIENHKKVMQKRTELLDSVILEVRKKCIEYTKSKAYAKRMTEKIEKIAKDFKDCSIVFRVNKDDSTVKKIIKDTYKNVHKIEDDDSIEIGGFIAVCNKKKLLTDETIDSKINEKRQWFYEHANLAVNI